MGEREPLWRVYTDCLRDAAVISIDPALTVTRPTFALQWRAEIELYRRENRIVEHNETALADNKRHNSLCAQYCPLLLHVCYYSYSKNKQAHSECVLQ